MKFNSDQTVAVSTIVYWEPISTCPQGVKVQLLGVGGVAAYGIYQRGDDNFWIGWSAVPARRKDIE